MFFFIPVQYKKIHLEDRISIKAILWVNDLCLLYLRIILL
jgi:hypothetical protein